ncbi:MAG: DUF1987 domain-containing protein [Bacteroidales bacterium]|nr:DUF1987 domain-containing protein [Bacteroidales bacterium]
MLEPINLEKTKNSPEIILNKQEAEFKIAGRSIVEDPKEFYSPIYNWLEEYIKTPLKNTEFTFDLEYFNSSSARQIMELIMLLEKIPKTGNSVKVLWLYEEGDEMSKERGDEIKLVSKLDFEINEYPSEDF